MSLGEFELIAKYFTRPSQSEHTLLGPGDDAAIVHVPEGHRLVVSVDTLVESVHYPKGAPADLIARRALRVNLSDMAAMAATPRWFTLGLTLPDAQPSWLERFSRGLYQDADAFGCELIGGDTTQGPESLSITIMGTVAADSSPLQRNGATPGDLLVVTGSLGDARGALNYLSSQDNDTSLNTSTDPNSTDPRIDVLLQRYWLPTPRTAFALEAHPFITAACDISDGLLADVGHICRASQLSVAVRAAQVPISNALATLCSERAQEFALTGGDDYELCMAVSPDNIAALHAIAARHDVWLTVLGEFRESAEPTVECVDEQGGIVAHPKTGYRHF